MKMKKYSKYLLIFIGFVGLLVLVDIISIYTRFKPILVIYNEGNHVYHGIFYDTYVCPQYTVPSIKSKSNKYSCFEKREIVSIVDKTKELKDFSCAEALEGFYEDEENEYYFSCIKGKYIVVKYSDDTEKTVREALIGGEITIKDLENYNIDFIIINKDE